MNLKTNNTEIFKNRLTVYHLYIQISTNEITKFNFIQNKYVQNYFKVIKKDQAKQAIYHKEYFASYSRKIFNGRINETDELAFLFNFIESISSFNFPNFTPIKFLNIVIKLIIDRMKNASPLHQNLLSHYFSQISINWLDLGKENALNLIKVCYNNISSSGNTDIALSSFYKYLFYVNLSFYLKTEEADINGAVALCSIDDLFTFVKYSMTEMKLDQCKTYIKLLTKKIEMNDCNNSYNSHKLYIDYPKIKYYQSAVDLFQLKQDNILLNLDLISPSLVDLMNGYIINKDRKSKINLIESIESLNSKDRNYLALRGHQIDQGNQNILIQIQLYYMTPLRLMELLTSFYNNLLIIAEKLTDFECDLIERLLFFILLRNTATEWQTLFQYRFFHIILFNLVQWYFTKLYSSNGHFTNYFKMIIVHKIYTMITWRLGYSLDPFKGHMKYLLKRKGDAYFKIERYDKARVIYESALSNYCNDAEGGDDDWKILLKICICGMKLFDYDNAKQYLKLAKEKIRQKDNEEYIKKKKAIFDAIERYLNLV